MTDSKTRKTCEYNYFKNESPKKENKKYLLNIDVENSPQNSKKALLESIKIKKISNFIVNKKNKKIITNTFFDDLLALEYLFILDPDKKKYLDLTEMLIVRIIELILLKVFHL